MSGCSECILSESESFNSGVDFTSLGCSTLVFKIPARGRFGLLAGLDRPGITEVLEGLSSREVSSRVAVVESGLDCLSGQRFMVPDKVSTFLDESEALVSGVTWGGDTLARNTSIDTSDGLSFRDNNVLLGAPLFCFPVKLSRTDFPLSFDGSATILADLAKSISNFSVLPVEPASILADLESLSDDFSILMAEVASVLIDLESVTSFSVLTDGLASALCNLELDVTVSD